MRDQADDILARAQDGDKAAFGSLVGTYQAMVFSAALHFFRNRATAEEIAQDVFFDLFRNVKSIESEAHLAAWLRRNTINRCIDRSRKKSSQLELAASDWDAPGRTDFEPDIFAYERVREQVACLPDEQRAVVILRFQEDLTPSEIAGTLRLPVNTVKSRLHRALGSLRQKMECKKGQPV